MDSAMEDLDSTMDSFSYSNSESGTSTDEEDVDATMDSCSHSESESDTRSDNSTDSNSSDIDSIASSAISSDNDTDDSDVSINGTDGNENDESRGMREELAKVFAIGRSRTAHIESTDFTCNKSSGCRSIQAGDATRKSYSQISWSTWITPGINRSDAAQPKHHNDSADVKETLKVPPDLENPTSNFSSFAEVVTKSSIAKPMPDEVKDSTIQPQNDSIRSQRTFTPATETQKVAYLFQFDPSTTESQIVSYLLRKNVITSAEDVSCKILVSPYEDMSFVSFVSFKVTVNSDIFDSVVDSELWPEGIAAPNGDQSDSKLRSVTGASLVSIAQPTDNQKVIDSNKLKDRQRAYDSSKIISDDFAGGDVTIESRKFHGNDSVTESGNESWQWLPAIANQSHQLSEGAHVTIKKNMDDSESESESFRLAVTESESENLRLAVTESESENLRLAVTESESENLRLAVMESEGENLRLAIAESENENLQLAPYITTGNRINCDSETETEDEMVPPIDDNNRQLADGGDTLELDQITIGDYVSGGDNGNNLIEPPSDSNRNGQIDCESAPQRFSTHSIECDEILWELRVMNRRNENTANQNQKIMRDIKKMRKGVAKMTRTVKNIREIQRNLPNKKVLGFVAWDERLTDDIDFYRETV
ncbi:dentin sialophosphoprotein-like [Bradysia coprophila]|uniref:dentin sialophosphoprotein-like n=1 Tax=Bradysia coprophila TaxID=38358 RepID=UPI00187DA5D5|nr:dentin sialophosphoprotein-like [Bradysia coprophila]